ncbi:MAG: NAD(P)H-binding protein [Alphaproteobacteria bacterium]|nr:NAD(P)H-binding protein [Alphaproteobacteria bacterium]
MQNTSERKSILMIGATGAVGGQVVQVLVQMPSVERITLLGRNPLTHPDSEKIEQHIVDVLNPVTYKQFATGHSTAICTLGVGQPSKVTKEDFLKVDRDAVLDFAAVCKKAGIGHFQLLSSVGADPASAAYYLRGKGELEQGLKDLKFDRLSLFHPSMILTPKNRYGPLQGLTLVVWPWLKPLLSGPLRKFRGISVDRLGRAMALNTDRTQTGVEVLEWDDFNTINNG